MYHRIRAYAPDIATSGSIVGVTADFTLETFSVSKGNVDVIVKEPDANEIPDHFALEVYVGKVHEPVTH
ncbi:filamin-A-like [Andrena cerasifolii]|uniref:filamin-A-like n=1 Tax=Andrena cerasifolii TaxID=2819439 RepID=UPI0040381FA1